MWQQFLLLALGLIGMSNSPMLVRIRIPASFYSQGLAGGLLGFSNKFVDHLVSMLESGATSAEKNLGDLKIDTSRCTYRPSSAAFDSD